MAAITNNITNSYENINNIRNIFNKLEDSKLEAFVFRKHIDYSLSNNFIKKETVPTNYAPSLKQNLKSQVEELKKLQCEIESVEERVRELEISKKIKQTKVNLYIN